MPILIITLLGVLGAVALYFVARRFNVEEDPRIDDIEALLPGANCGACGCNGCRDFAATCVSRGRLDGLCCPGAGAEAMARIAEILGVEAQSAAPLVAVLKCSGDCNARPARYEYDGVRSCMLMNATGVGTTACGYGCLGCGDCVKVCAFGALSIDPATGLSVIDRDLCTGCGVCTRSCPRQLLELRPRRSPVVYVACSNRDRGAVARKDCAAACIGCGKCVRVCGQGAIELRDNHAYISADKCLSCGECQQGCPTRAIHSI